MKQHIVMYSGGKASFLVAHKVKERYPQDDIVLLFSDTKTEDEDLYRFLREGASKLDLPLIEICDGRDIWKVFKDTRFLGNNRVPVCSRILKQEISRTWVDENYSEPSNVTIHFGIDWTEAHRAERIPKHWEPYGVDFPLLWEPVADKEEADELIESLNFEPPRLYALGAPHNNCGGLCVRAGHAHFKWALTALPERYKEWEEKEEELRQHLDANVSILRDRRGGTSKPMTLAAFRERIETKNTGQLDLLEWGGCGCMSDYE
tara:strand:+ start:145 stop:930 length:786 start_codon:yes stop_codon:yes gene_type:complete